MSQSTANTSLYLQDRVQQRQESVVSTTSSQADEQPSSHYNNQMNTITHDDIIQLLHRNVNLAGELEKLLESYERMN